MAKMTGIRFGRLALIGAAGVAIIAVAVRYRSDTPGTTSTQEAAPAANAGELAAMVPKIEAKLRENPKDPVGWRMLGMAQFNLARFPEAAQAYARATELDPGNAELWSSLGETLIYARRNGVDDDAARAFRRAREIDPKDPRARYFLAVKQDIDGDHRGAIDEWIALLRETPAGAPWEKSVRELVEAVAAREKIDISGRLPAPAVAGGADVARAGIAGPSSAEIAAGAKLRPSEQAAMARGMVDRLAARLASDPSDADGWIRLMRARLVLGEREAALKAKADAERAFGDDTATRARIDEAAKALGL